MQIKIVVVMLSGGKVPNGTFRMMCLCIFMQEVLLMPCTVAVENFYEILTEAQNQSTGTDQKSRICHGCDFCAFLNSSERSY